MGMTIDEAIGWIKKSILDMRRAQICITDRLALETAIDTMRKYQKIEDIYYHQSGQALEDSLRSVIEKEE